MICACCKNTFYYGKRNDGLPNGAGFVLSDGKRIDICTDCIMKLPQNEDYMKVIKNINNAYKDGE